MLDCLPWKPCRELWLLQVNYNTYSAYQNPHVCTAARTIKARSRLSSSTSDSAFLSSSFPSCLGTFLQSFSIWYQTRVRYRDDLPARGRARLNAAPENRCLDDSSNRPSSSLRLSRRPRHGIRALDPSKKKMSGNYKSGVCRLSRRVCPPSDFLTANVNLNRPWVRGRKGSEHTTAIFQN